MNVVAPPQSGVPLVGDENLFDSLFSSERSLLNLLIAIRAADINDDDKLELRDLVLEYAQLRDPAKKQSIKNQLNSFLKKHTAILETALNNQVEVNTAAAKMSTTTKAEVPAAKPVLKRSIGASRLNPVFKQSATKPKMPEVAKAAPQGVAAREGTKAPLSETTPAKTPETTPMMAPHIANPMERINEIKRLVNSKVGNPINLIDSDNNVGREYMNALLDAMKKSSGSGLAGELDVAMSRLEQAYLAVEAHITGHPQLLVSQATAVKESPAPAAAKVPVIEESEVAVLEPLATVIPIKKLAASFETPKEKVVAREPDLPWPKEVKKPESKTSGRGLVQEPEEDFREAALAEPKPSALSSLAAKLFVDRSQSGAAAPAKAKVTPLKDMGEPSPKDSAVKIESAIPGITPAPHDEPVRSTALSPVSNDDSVTKKITSFREEMKKQDAKDKLPVTELNAPEVTEGLSQLLSEWKLFKSSGFLGTGPSGIDHPLYLRLKVMPMASVIAGRFEGASPEIKQSITDYMNGWRYEQGLIHEMGETFEHYLRRVIMHILERQTETPKA